MHNALKKYGQGVYDQDEFLQFDDRQTQYITPAEFYQAGFEDVHRKVRSSLEDIQEKKDLTPLSYRKQGLFSKAYYELCKLFQQGNQAKGKPEQEKKFIKETENYYLDEFQKEEWKLYEKDYELVPYFNSANQQLDNQIQEESCQAVIDSVANNVPMTDKEFNSQPSQQKNNKAQTSLEEPQKDNKTMKYAAGGLAVIALIAIFGGNDNA